jgi:polyisoprenoid-binding protein YceI
MKNLRLYVCVLSLAAGLTSTASANPADKNNTYQVSGAQVVVVCPLTVGGRFEAKTQAVSGEVSVGANQPGTLKGALSVDLRTLKTGIGMRDRHMRANYLEVDKGPGFDQATIEDIKIEKLDGKTTFSGTLVLHGERKAVTGSATLQARDGGYSVQAEFPVRVSEFNIPKPTYLGVGVQDEIQIKIAMTVTSTTTTARAK